MRESIYAERLAPWVIYSIVGLTRRIVGKHRKRSEAEQHVAVLRRMATKADYVIAYEIHNQSAELNGSELP